LYTRAIDAISPVLTGRGELTDRILAMLLALTIAVPAFMTGDRSMKPLFYALFILPTLALIVTGRISLKEIFRDVPLLALLAIPLLYWSATNLWTVGPDVFLSFLRRSLTLAVFLCGVAHVVRSVGREFEAYLDVALFLVALGAALILVRLPFVEPPGPVWRPGDGSVFNRALHASHYFGFFATYALVRAYQVHSMRRALAMLLAGTLCLAFVFATESRGTLVSLAGAGLVISVYWQRRYRHALVLLLVCAVGFLAMHEMLLQRGFSYRGEIWAGSMDLIGEYFWFGAGMGNNLEVAYGDKFLAPHAHNLLLDVQIKSGIFGLLLFLVIVGFIVWRVLVGRPEERVFSATLLFFLLCVTSDVHKLINSPTTSYIIFWLPLAGLLVTYSTGAQAARSLSPAGRGQSRAENE
jgi:O-antigen ligase